MQMILSVVADGFVDDLINALLDKAIPVTEISSSGGFLSQGNTTLVIGLEKEKFSLVDEIFSRVIGEKKENPQEPGAHLFAINLERGLRI